MIGPSDPPVDFASHAGPCFCLLEKTRSRPQEPRSIQNSLGIPANLAVRRGRVVALSRLPLDSGNLDRDVKGILAFTATVNVHWAAKGMAWGTLTQKMGGSSAKAHAIWNRVNLTVAHQITCAMVAGPLYLRLVMNLATWVLDNQ